MARHDPTPEQRDEALDRLTRQNVAGITADLAAGQEATVILIDEALGDFMQDDQARAELLRKTAAGENALQVVLADLIFIEAAARAGQQVLQLERERRQSFAEQRIERVLDAQPA